MYLMHEDVLFNISEHDKFTGHINQMKLWIKKIVIMRLLSRQHQRLGMYAVAMLISFWSFFVIE
jgi:hypothetical protein